MLLQIYVFIYLIPNVISLSSQEDLSIPKYSQISCIKFRTDQQFLVNNIQENFLLPYQTFSSPSMTIELCFRLCRRWFILVSNNQTNCICLYTIHQDYEIREYFGEMIPNATCTSNDVKIYSLTNDIQILPRLSTSDSADWSFDGCYYIHGIQLVNASLSLNQYDYIQAIDLCRKHCRTFRETDYYSYYLSLKKSCYCLPVTYSHLNQEIIALRKPLKHCSFHPSICNGFSNQCENYYSNTSANTLIKIDVQNYCSSTKFSSYVFDRVFFRCFDSIPLQIQMNFSTINYDLQCLPLIIQTAEQWNYLTQSIWINSSNLFFAIDRNSTYVFNELFRYSNLTLLPIDFCLMINRTETNKIFYELMSCADVRSPGYVLCSQKPFPSLISSQEDFQNNRYIQSDKISCVDLSVEFIIDMFYQTRRIIILEITGSEIRTVDLREFL